MKLSPTQIDALIYNLQGTCLSLEEGLFNTFGITLSDVDNETEMCDRLDNAIFLCRECGWWCECGDWNSDGFEPGDGEICLQCMPKED